MIWQATGGAQFLGMGTYNGQGTTVGNCPTDHQGWNVYADGVIGTTHFCHQLGIQLGMNASGNRFKIRWGDDCGSAIKAGFYLNNLVLDCRTILVEPGWVHAGGEAIKYPIQPPFPKLDITVHYYNFDKHGYYTGSWTNVGGGSSACDPSTDYDIQLVANDNFWAKPK